MSIQKVCLVGANGTLGAPILHALLAEPSLQTSILQRANSQNKLPASISSRLASVVPFSPDFDPADLTAALRGFDAVVAAFPLADVQQHLRLAEAACEAGVQRYIPADYGSCDAADEKPQKTLQLYRDKQGVRDRCEQLAAEASKTGKPFTWTTIVCGHFFDYGIKGGLLHFNLATRTAHILDGGDDVASASSLSRVAETVVAIFKHAAQTANRPVYVQSFKASQNQVLASLEKATGQKWTRENLDSEKYLAETVKRFEAGDREALEDAVFVLGQIDADWTGRKDYAMDLLELKEENLDEVVARAVKEWEETQNGAP